MEIQWHLVEKDFFSGLPEQKREFLSLASLRSVAKKDFIFQEGNFGGSAFYLEEGKIRIEVHKDAIKKGDRVLLIDDLLATGGTALASAALIEKLGGTVVEMAFIVDLPDVGGKKKLKDKGYKVYALTEFEGD